MDNMHDNLMPGTATARGTRGESGFAKIEMLLLATGGLSLSQVCAVTGLEGTTIQNWVKRGWVAHPKGKKYEEKHISRILIINALKDCIKLEHIAQLMEYTNGATENSSNDIIKESELYNYLCGALMRLGQVEDLSRGGIDAIVEAVITDYSGPTPLAHVKIRKALTVMIYACVCTDAKRRTEAMMRQVLQELENPENLTLKNLSSGSLEIDDKEDDSPGVVELEMPSPEPKPKPKPMPMPTGGDEVRKTVAQAIREWDLKRVEEIIEEKSESVEAPVDQKEPANSEQGKQKPSAATEKQAQKPWYFRRN